MQSNSRISLYELAATIHAVLHNMHKVNAEWVPKQLVPVQNAIAFQMSRKFRSSSVTFSGTRIRHFTLDAKYLRARETSQKEEK
jgi:hypothetical protein